MYVDENGTRFEHIHLLEIESGGYLSGWYFSDEVNQLHGPFSTFEETLSLLCEYGEALR
jgi:hypothetical protein